MGVAAYNRGSAAISRQIADEARPVEFQIMDELNALPKYDDAGTPFGDIRFVPGHGGVWAECPTTGYGFWYRTLREAMRRWRVEIYACDHGIFTARPLPRRP